MFIMNVSPVKGDKFDIVCLERNLTNVMDMLEASTHVEEFGISHENIEHLTETLSVKGN